MRNNKASTNMEGERRDFLRSVAGAAVAAGALAASPAFGQSLSANAATGPAVAAAPVKGYFDVTQYGATGNGTVNDTPAIQATINAAVAKGGGVVWFPPGLYLIGGPLTVPKQLILAGAGWETPPWEQPSSKFGSNDGSKLYVKSTSFVPITITGRGTLIRDLAIYHDQPAPAANWVPKPYQTTCQVSADDVRMENLLLFNPTIGITSQNAQRLTLSRIWGQPMVTGISIDSAYDVVKIDNIHFWPFWSVDANVKAYTTQNGRAIVSLRNDNPHFSNIFVLWYFAGFVFGQSATGVTSKFRIVNADNDLCFSGIRLEGSGTTGQVTNYTFQGSDAPIVPECGIIATADGVTLQASNVRITGAGANAVRVSGSNSEIFVEGLWAESWDQRAVGFPAVEAYNPSASISLGFGRTFRNGHSAQTGGTGTVLLDT